MVVHGALVAGTGGADSRRCRLIVHALGPGEDRGYSQVVGAMLKLDVHRVVVGVAAPVAVNVETVEVRKRQTALHRAWGLSEVDIVAAGVSCLAEREARSRDGIGLGDIAPVQKMDGMGPNVVQFKGRVPCQLTLD